MTSLEFIKKEIKSDEDFIKILRRDAQLGFKWENVDIEFFEKRIAHLQQIKSELEAWEVVKKKVKPVLKMDKEDYQPAYYWWIADELINLDTLDYQKLKQALEVEE